MGDKRSTNIHKIKNLNWVTNSIGNRGIKTDRSRIYIFENLIFYIYKIRNDFSTI